MVDKAIEDKLVADVERDAHALAVSVKNANEAGVSEALIFPALVGVFREAGILPADLDLGSLFSLLG